MPGKSDVAGKPAFDVILEIWNDGVDPFVIPANLPHSALGGLDIAEEWSGGRVFAEQADALEWGLVGQLNKRSATALRTPHQQNARAVLRDRFLFAGFFELTTAWAESRENFKRWLTGTVDTRGL